MLKHLLGLRGCTINEGLMASLNGGGSGVGWKACARMLLGLICERDEGSRVGWDEVWRGVCGWGGDKGGEHLV